MSNNKTLNMDTFADHIIAVAKKNKLPITNLQLHKIMYFTLKLAKDEKIAINGELKPMYISDEILKEMYDQPFEVWKFGPVVRKQYLRFRRFSCEFIIGSFEQTDILKPLNNVIIELLKENVFTLAEISTRIPFWIQNSDNINNSGTSEIEYSFDDI